MSAPADKMQTLIFSNFKKPYSSHLLTTIVKGCCPHLKECTCREPLNRMNSAMRGELRVEIDGLMTKLVKNKPSNSPIRLLSIGAGQLMQEATVSIALMQQGYSVEWIIIDPLYAREEDINKKWLHVERALLEFSKLVSELNIQFNTHSKISGIFSSYMVYHAMLRAGAQASAPQFLVLNKFDEAFIKPYSSGGKPFPHWKMITNAKFKEEYEKYFDACKGFLPDIVMTIDTIQEFGDKFNRPMLNNEPSMFGGDGEIRAMLGEMNYQEMKTELSELMTAKDANHVCNFIATYND